MIIKYENECCDKIPSLLQSDEYCFSVLLRILRGKCRLTLTDGERLVICHSCDPDPVWVWLPDDASADEMALAYETVRAYFAFGVGYRFNLKYDLAAYFIRRAAVDGVSLKTVTNMLAYKCPVPLAPRPTLGVCRTALPTDLALATRYLAAFHDELRLDQTDEVSYRRQAHALIGEERLFFWEDETGECAAMASYAVFEGKGAISHVYTREDKRRRGYAASLVYTLSLRLLASGVTPCLYTDADYEASNACYEAVGFVRVGSLCTVG